MSDTHRFSRRKFLQYTGALTGAATTFSLASAIPAPAQGMDAHAQTADQPLSRGKMFFSNNLEFQTLSAACERIFPKDDNGPGAIELAVPYFIDNQLAGAYGYNAREYICGPWAEGAPGQGYQTPLLRREVFKHGLAALNEHAQSLFSQNFPGLGGEQQDQVLADCEGGKIATAGFSSGYFFSLLRNAVLAGVYADPIYNGNNNMDGWRMKEYPGAQMAYIYLMTSLTFMKIEPVSLSGM